jgi:carboxylesterase type B
VQVIADSPYLPLQYGYKDWLPSQIYYAFAHKVGCLNDTAYGNTSATVFACLQAADTTVLQSASAQLSGSGNTGTWGFLPVTDGIFLQQTPSQQLLKKQVNGIHILSGNNVNEGEPFVIQNISTEDELIGWIHQEFPLLTNGDISKLLMYYPSTNASDDPNTPKYATLGDDGGPTAVNVSQLATGHQQRANVMYTETTFICPAYWLVEAFADKGRAAFKYQYSVPVATHGADLSAVFGPPTPNQSPEFFKAFQTLWGNFIMQDNPSVPDSIANVTGPNVLANFPVFSPAQPSMVILNETGGVPYSARGNAILNVTQFEEPGLQNWFRIVNAYTFEGGRGTRCDFWRSVAAIVPE